VADFPDVSPGAVSDLAGSLRRISESVALIGLDTGNVRDSVTASEQWQGSASEEWRAVVTDRVGDAGLTNAVMGSAAAMLSGLADDLAAERGTYDRLSSQLYSVMLTQGVASRFAAPVQVVNPDVQLAMDACAARAAQLLEDAARQLLGYALLAGDIHAVPVADRTPGVPDGAGRRAASLRLLAMLFGLGDREPGGRVAVRAGRLEGTGPDEEQRGLAARPALRGKAHGQRPGPRHHTGQPGIELLR
jgi:hypothetical protein